MKLYLRQLYNKNIDKIKSNLKGKREEKHKKYLNEYIFSGNEEIEEEAFQKMVKTANHAFRRILNKLIKVINKVAREIESNPNSAFLNNPSAFTRATKLKPIKLIKLIFLMENKSIQQMQEQNQPLIRMISDMLGKEFVDDTTAPVTASTFHYAREKLSSYAFQYIFNEMENYIRGYKKWKSKYILLAVDGSEYENYLNWNEGNCIKALSEDDYSNAFHLNAIRDAVNGHFVDAEIQDMANKDENAALRTMVDRLKSRLSGPDTVFIMDRGYHSAVNMLHISNRQYKFVLRLRECDGKFYGYELPEGKFDRVYELTFRRKGTGDENKAGVYYLETPEELELLQGKDSVTMKVRVIQTSCEVTVENIENDESKPEQSMLLVTNISSDELTDREIRMIYYHRWEIETAFRFLKCQLDSERFHSRSLDLMKQEVWAKLVFFNIVIGGINANPFKQTGNSHLQNPNVSMAVSLTRQVLQLYLGVSHKVLPYVMFASDMQRYKIGIRPGRSFGRNQSKSGPVGAFYPNA